MEKRIQLERGKIQTLFASCNKSAGAVINIDFEIVPLHGESPCVCVCNSHEQMRFEAFHSLWLGSNYCLFMHLLLLPLQPKK